tara:strand:- start:56 stop:202 length:147 start_codon:yes stop_codon:yes gene_type:complete
MMKFSFLKSSQGVMQLKRQTPYVLPMLKGLQLAGAVFSSPLSLRPLLA